MFIVFFLHWRSCTPHDKHVANHMRHAVSERPVMKATKCPVSENEDKRNSIFFPLSSCINTH